MACELPLILMARPVTGVGMAAYLHEATFSTIAALCGHGAREPIIGIR
jgi:hypothetical protein